MRTRITGTTLDPETVTLGAGGHASPEDGVCVMEMASILAGEEFGDSPACVSPVIATFLRSWNDGMGDEDRQKLKPYAARVIGTRTTDADEETRAWMATDWLVRVQTPAWLRLAGLTAEAQSLEALARITDATPARAAQPTIEGARGKAAAAWAAARDAAWAAARDAARDAAWDAARAAARAAAGDAAGDAAWAAARDAARDAAWAAAWAADWAAATAAARAAAWAAAWAAARDAAWAAARDAAWAAATDALRPTVEVLQVSAFGLLDAMIAVGRTPAKEGV